MSIHLPRFSATPEEVHRFLMEHLAEDVHLRYQQWVGAAAVRDACDGIRSMADEADAWTQENKPLGDQPGAEELRGVAALLDPDEDGGPWPIVLARRFAGGEPSLENYEDTFANRGGGRCDAPAMRGKRRGTCDRPLDTLGRCTRAGAHLDAEARR